MKEFRRLSNGWERYEVSQDGTLRNVYTGRIIKGTLGKEKNNEYIHIRIKQNGKNLHKRLHQLVMEAWGAPKPKGEYVIDHIDQNKQNNHINNLRWVTREENVKNSKYYTSGQRSADLECRKFPKKEVYVNDILFNSRWEACKYIKANIETKCSVKNLCDRMYLRRKNIFGFKIEYVE